MNAMTCQLLCKLGVILIIGVEIIHQMNIVRSPIPKFTDDLRPLLPYFLSVHWDYWFLRNDKLRSQFIRGLGLLAGNLHVGGSNPTRRNSRMPAPCRQNPKRSCLFRATSWEVRRGHC